MAVITSTSADEKLKGTGGNNTFVFLDNSGRDTISDTAGNDTLDFSRLVSDSLEGGTYFPAGQNGLIEEGYSIPHVGFVITGEVSYPPNLISTIIGSNTGDALSTNTGNVSIWGKGGNDQLTNDAQTGYVNLIGGAGNDQINSSINANNTTFSFYSGSGNDTVGAGGGWNQINLLNGEAEDKIIIFSQASDPTHTVQIGYTDSTDQINIINWARNGSSYTSGQWINKTTLQDGKFASAGDINTLLQDMSAYAKSHHITLNSLNDVKQNPDLMAMIQHTFHQ